MLVQNLNIKIIFLFILIVLYTLLFSLNIQNRDEAINKELARVSKKFSNALETLIDENYYEAQTISSIIEGESFISSILTQAIKATPKEQDILKKRLFKKTVPLFHMAKTQGVSKISFILPNNHFFLELDSQAYNNSSNHNTASVINSDVIKLGKENRGFEYSNNTMLYSYFFPIIDANGNFIGSYTISYSLQYIQKLLLEIDQISMQYFNSLSNLPKPEIFSEEFEHKIKREVAFSMYKKVNSEIEIVSIYPLHTYEKAQLHYLYSSSKNTYIEEELERYLEKNIAALLITFLILLLLYRVTIHQKNIQEEKERFQLAIDSSNDGLWDWKISHNTTYFSPRFLAMLGSKAGTLNFNFDELVKIIHPQDQKKFTSEIEKLLRFDNGYFECEYRVKHENGNWLWILGRAKATFDNNSKAIRAVGFHSDITLKKEYEEKQDKLIQELKDVATSKSDFLANMSHEIRTPMNAILGFIQILIKQETDPKKLKKFNIINNSGQSLLRIINDILDFSKIESNKMLIESLPYNIKEMFQHIKSLYNTEAKNLNITIDLEIENTLPKESLGDKIRIEQVLSNFLSNALKFSNENSTIKINVFKEGDQLKCEVIDQGIGIAKEKLEHIFESFTQEDSSTTRKYGGTGLGLTISKRLCELMGGSIGLESELGKGSKFFFYLPLKEPKEEQALQIQTSPEQSQTTLKGHILVAEDNKTNQLLLSMMLDEYNLSYKIANDGLEAIEIFKTEKFDLILMDENMPRMNGTQAAKSIKMFKESKGVPIIAVTANALDGARDKFLQAGMDEYISKPIDSDKLYTLLSQYLGQKGA